ncbi:MAG: N-formylglutamate deformylase [Pseudomonadota bacterium]
MTEPTYAFTPGSTPLLISVPHAGTLIPSDLRQHYTPDALTVPDTDWHVPLLYQFALQRGAGLLAATHSRYLIDLNRNPDGAVLYAGADNTELCPTKSFAQAPLYHAGLEPDAAEVARRREQYWRPYHMKLATELARTQQQHGYAILLDGHSIRAEVPRFFEGRLPDLNLGTADGSSCSTTVQQAAETVLAKAAGFSFIANGRFKGGTITRRYGQPGQGVHALQLEMAQACYMDEAPPYSWQPERAAALMQVLRQLVDTLLGLSAAPLLATVPAKEIP